MKEDHVEHTVRSIARLRTEHHESATRLQRFQALLTGWLAQPRALVILMITVVIWVGLNLFLTLLGRTSFDPPPFLFLSDVIGLLSLFMVVLIISAQRHEEQLAQRRELLLLELAVRSEQKIAKVIALIEEMRSDHPLLPDRSDHGAETLAQPSDPGSVLDAIKQAQQSPK